LVETKEKMIYGIQTIPQFAGFLQEYPQTVTWIEKVKPRLYNEFKIPKHKGGFRSISTLVKKDNEVIVLKRIQRKIKEKIIDNIIFPDSVHGFVKGKDIYTCAKVHSGHHIVVSLDIKDFFDSIKAGRLIPLFQNLFNMEWQPAWLFAQLVTFKGRLPQGTYTSPGISNLYMYYFDLYMDETFKESGMTYTRYADDITFSGDFSKEEAKEYIKFIKAELQKLGLKLNKKKTKIYEKPAKQIVLGMVVNDHPNISREERFLLKAMIYNFVHKHIINIDYTTDPKKYKRILMGKINHVLHANPNLATFIRYKEELRKLDPNKIKDWNLMTYKEG